ncbi:MAG TPA: hypothetical protein VG986_21350 [Pseudolabrys sp.]|nr:hypothetical protein [Pseudolabrys sp.]
MGSGSYRQREPVLWGGIESRGATPADANEGICAFIEKRKPSWQDC